MINEFQRFLNYFALHSYFLLSAMQNSTFYSVKTNITPYGATKWRQFPTTRSGLRVTKKHFHVLVLFRGLDGEILRQLQSSCLASSFKTHLGDWSFVGRKPPKVCNWNENFHNENLTFIRNIDEYSKIRNAISDILGRICFFLFMILTMLSLTTACFSEVSDWSDAHSCV